MAGEQRAARDGWGDLYAVGLRVGGGERQALLTSQSGARLVPRQWGPRLEEAADIMAGLAEQAYTSGGEFNLASWRTTTYRLTFWTHLPSRPTRARSGCWT